MKLFRKRFGKVLASYLAVSILTQLGAPLMVFAVSGGTVQPSNYGSPVGSTEMVDLFTGDFKYNIPLFELPGPDGGYPFSLNYNSGISMDQEASWVGLGWSLSPGAINRGVNGFPDEFENEKVREENDMKANITFGATAKGDLEALGFSSEKFSKRSAEFGLSIYYNNYRGIGYSIDPNTQFNFGAPDKNKNALIDTATLGLDFGFDSQEGFNFEPQVSLTSISEKNSGRNILASDFSIGVNYSTTEGLSSISSGFTRMKMETSVLESSFPKIEVSYKTFHRSISTIKPSYTPSIGLPMQSEHTKIDFKTGVGLYTIFKNIQFGGFYTTQQIAHGYQDHSLHAYGYNNFHKNTKGERGSYDFNREKDIRLSKFTKNLAIPSITNDNFSVSGAGIGGVFRAFRNDLGMLHDAYSKSYGTKVNLAFDVGPNKGEIEGGGGYDESTSGTWKSTGNAMNGFSYDDQRNGVSKDYEPYYLKMKGEHTPINEEDLNYIGYEDVVRLRMVPDLNPLNDFEFSAFEIRPKLVSNTPSKVFSNAITNSADPATEAKTHTFGHERRIKGTVITSPKVKDVFGNYVLTGSNDPLLPEYNISNAFRGKRNHPAGYTVTPTSGVKYVYALPSYNMKKVDCSYSTDHTFRKVEGTGTSSFDQNDFSIKADVIETTDGNEMNPNFTRKKPKYKYKAAKQKGKSNHYFKRTTIPEYANAYLLTSLLGTDYVDIKSDGPTEDDLGYWVKFDYDKTSDTDGLYKWRAPFSNSMFNEGADKESWADNTANYSYGEREMFYLEKVSTKTHVAIFTKSLRHDARGVSSEYQGDDGHTNLGSYSYKLDKIDLYTKAEFEKGITTAIPLKTVHFEYTYDLCGGVENNDHGVENVTTYDAYGNVIENSNINSRNGKLTLKKVYFTYKGNKRGMLNPYVFDYHEGKTQNTATEYAENPDYNEFMNDKWGMYSYRKGLNNFFPNGGNAEDRELYNNQLNNYNYPYTHQPSPSMEYPSNFVGGVDEGGFDRSLQEQRKEQDIARAVWNLKAIDLPSGARLEVDYEADDYAYVHDQPAMQMFKILGFEDGNGNIIQHIEHGKKGDNNSATKIFFKLTEPIPNTIAAKEKAKQAYMKNFKDLYFNVDMYLKDEGDLSQVITGWADVLEFGFGADGDTNPELDFGWVKVKKEKAHYNKKDTKVKYHPISFAAWQYMSNYMNRYVYNGKSKSVSDDANDDEKGARAKSMLSAFRKFGAIFGGGFYTKAKKNNWSTHVKLDRSYIRLYNPIKKKIGGGCRVKQIALYDNWDEQAPGEKESVYGQVYDYTTIEDGEVISSGVASYEPLAGGDENPLRRVKSHEVKKRLKLNKEVNFLYPINEHMYPSPMVGYSKVNVKSLATHYEAIDGADDQFNIPGGIMTTGATEYEFYTTKDYPFISEETKLFDKPVKFKRKSQIVAVNVDRFYATQGYMMTTNDMHGKPKRVTHLEQLNNGTYNDKNVPYVEYTYKSKNKTYYDGFEHKTVKVLDNKVEVLVNKYGNDVDNDNKVHATTTHKLIGLDWDVALDTRQSRSWSVHASPEFNVDGFIWPFPLSYLVLPNMIPNVSYTEKVVKTAVINKVFYKHGILEEVKTFDGQATIVARDKVYDGLTGRPVLSTVTNQFDEQIYQYSPSLHMEYRGAGAAYENIGITFKGLMTSEQSNNLDSLGNINGTTDVEEHLFTVEIISGGPVSKLVSGDEFVIKTEPTLGSITFAKATLIKKLSDNLFLFSALTKTGSLLDGIESAPATADFLLTRSGKRNLLGGADETLVSKSNPLLNIQEDDCTVNEDDLVDLYGNRAFFEGPHYSENKMNWYMDRLHDTYNFALSNYNNSGSFNSENKDFETRSDYLPIGLNNDHTRFLNGIYINYDSVNSELLISIRSYVTGGYSHHDNIITDSVIINSFLSGEVEFGLPIPANGQMNYGPVISSAPNTFTFYVPLLINGQVNSTYLSGRYTNVAQIRNVLIGIKSVLGQPIIFNQKKQDNILAIGASPLTDVSYYSDQVNALNPYRSGEKGIWRSGESYAYVKDRVQVKNAQGEIDLKASGHMDTVTLFDPQNYYQSQCSPDWRKISEITKYNADGYQLESKDILGIHSSALYDSKSEQLMAMAVNARLDEILFEDFEDQTRTGGNFDFTLSQAQQGDTYFDCETYTIEAANGDQAIVNLPYSPDWGNSSNERQVKVEGANVTSFAHKEVFGTYTAKMLPLYEANGTTLKPEKSVLSFENDPSFITTINWAGKVSVCTNEPYYSEPGGVIGVPKVKDFGHTGKQSLEVSTESLVRELRKLDLEPNQAYSLQVWASFGENSGNFYKTFGETSQGVVNGNNATVTRDEIGVKIGYTTSSNGTITWTNLFTPEGAIINDWQLINAEFQVPEDVEHVFIQFPISSYSSGNTVGTSVAFYDDLRICPKDAEMTTYVYNKDFYRLMAQLDDRNYAMFYHYDDQGATYTMRVETEKGIRTLTDARAHASEK